MTNKKARVKAAKSFRGILRSHGIKIDFLDSVKWIKTVARQVDGYGDSPVSWYFESIPRGCECGCTVDGDLIWNGHRISRSDLAPIWALWDKVQPDRDPGEAKVKARTMVRQ